MHPSSGQSLTPHHSSEEGSPVGINLGFVAFISLAINILMLTGPLYMLQIYDRVVSSGSLETLIFLSLAAGGLLLANGLLESFRSQLSNNLAIKYQITLAPRILKVLAKKSTTSDKKKNSRPLQDLETVQKFYSSNILLACMDFPWTPLFLGVLFVLHPVLGFTAVVGALVLITIAILTEILTRKLHATASQKTNDSMEFADRLLANSDAVNSMGMFAQLEGVWKQGFDSGAALQTRANDRAAFLRGMTKFFRPLLQMGILGFGALLVINGELSAGSMVAASILMGKALAPIEQVVSGWRTVLQTKNAHKRLKEFIEKANVRNVDAISQPQPTGVLNVKNISVYTPGSQTPILQKITFSLGAGEALAIVGASGAGKSTLARAIAGAFELDHGEVRLDGIEHHHWPDNQRANNIGFLPQDVQLFTGNIAQNICRFTDGEETQIHEAAKLADVTEIINRLPNGYLTKLQDSGAPLSPGQRQRIALARALYNAPTLLVLDEPNAHLDSEGEAALVRVISCLKKRGATVVLVTHKSSLMAQMDKVLVLSDGKMGLFEDKSKFVNQLSVAA